MFVNVHTTTNTTNVHAPGPDEGGAVRTVCVFGRFSCLVGFGLGKCASRHYRAARLKDARGDAEAHELKC